MGWVKEAKSNALATEAQRAIEEGRTIFTPRLNAGNTAHGFSGSIAGWAEMIEAVEECGWRLEHWAASEHDGRPVGLPLFRRA
jgi:hypothetical protein